MLFSRFNRLAALPFVLLSSCSSDGAVDDSGAASACPAGSLSCACYQDQSCDAGLACEAAACRALSAQGTGGGAGSGTGGNGAASAVGGSGVGSGGAANAGGTPGADGGAASGGTDSAGGSGGGGAASGGAASGGAGTGGDMGAGGGPIGEALAVAGNCSIGLGVQEGDGTTDEQYLDADVTRDGKNYMMITNGWGQGWLSHQITWNGTSMFVDSFEGSRQSNGAPAGYPSLFCGIYSKTSKDCGLPADLTAISQLNTGLSWSHEAGDGTYNVAYDVWMGEGGRFSSYFMVWLHNPDGEGPAGSKSTTGVTVANVPGVWDIYDGTVNSRPIVNYVRPDGEATEIIAFDMMDFINDGRERGLDFPGDGIQSMAIGFEIWQGSVTDLRLNDFCIDVQ